MVVSLLLDGSMALWFLGSILRFFDVLGNPSKSGKTTIITSDFFCDILVRLLVMEMVIVLVAGDFPHVHSCCMLLPPFVHFLLSSATVKVVAWHEPT